MDILGPVTTRAASVLRATALAGAVLLASGCAVFSPVQTDYAYQPADGPGLDTGAVQLRNLVVVAAEEGASGVLVGQAVNDSAESVELTFAVAGATGSADQPPASRVVPASSGGAISTDGSQVVLAGVPQGPGGLVELTVGTPETGQNIVQVPVLAPTGYYEPFAAPAVAPLPSPSSS